MIYSIPKATAISTLLTSPPPSSHFSSKPNAAAVKLKLSVKPPSNNTLTASSSLPSQSHGVTDKLNGLASEFASLSEPIDRVKRLLHYASLLPPLDRSDRVPKNRVSGCSTEIWVVARMDSRRKMRFKADSDSEISKGFCWCLVWMLDGAEPEEVLTVENDDLMKMNLGLSNVKSRSRINTWHNVFFAMQKATQDLI